MNITCPSCGFSRKINDNKLQDKAVIATCPQCSCRFRFSKEKGVIEILPKAPDDPLPPGAVILKAENEEKIPESESINEDNNQILKDKETDTEDQDLRFKANMAYAKEAARQAEEQRLKQQKELFQEPIPWEYAPEPDGWIAAFYQTFMRVLFNPTRFFLSLKPNYPYLKALIFFLIICIFQTIVLRFWTDIFFKYFLSTDMPSEMENLLNQIETQSSLPLTILLNCALETMRLYIFSGIITFIYRFIVGDRSNFSLTFQILAYGYSPALLCIIPFLGSIVGMIWSIACIITGCRIAMGLSWSQTLIGFVPLFVLQLILFMKLMQTLQPAL